jgi:hypothetical protein
VSSPSNGDSAATSDPPDGVAADIIGQVVAIERFEKSFLETIELFPQSAARQIATQRFMETTFWLVEALKENP